MLSFLAVIHVFVGIGLVVFVLLQDPKGGAAGIFGGGSSSNTFFGSSGASDFLGTATKWLAVVFACTSLALTAYTTKKTSSVLDQAGDSVPAPAPSASSAAAPGAAPVGVGSSAPAAPSQAAPSAPAANPPEQK